MSQLPQSTIEAAFLAACRAELAALKPGNVHVHSDGHGMTVATFEAAAVAAAPHLAARGASVGARIEAATRASVQAVGCNANLGIVLLCAPLAAAAEHGDGHLRLRVAEVLDHVTVADAAAAYRAIALANPAGLGTVPEQDVANVPSVTLLEAMALAYDHDRIAVAYVDDFQDIFDFALPCLATARLSSDDEPLAITVLHMSLMAKFADSHVVRKHGAQTAAELQAEAHRLRTAYLPAVDADGFAELMRFDEDLKRRGLNPGTTADLVVAALFADALMVAEREARGHDSH
ncbi:MAG: triphosphoribosyl-dephospho-CoA synthase [Hyphomicrobium aestuarii]|nr:triphosphoribosyl-dephospho-CoA synthase [Hyphomicrobium aestuarii]